MSFPDDFNNIPNENEETSAPKENTPEEPRQTYETDESTSNMWREPKYEVSTTGYDDAYSPSVNLRQDTKEKPKKEKKSHGFIKAVCLVLACVLLSSGSCYLIVSAMLKNQEPAEVVNNNQVVLGSSGSTVNPDTIPIVDNTAAAQIYSMACNFQVVGINTSVNTTNIWGQATTYPVSGTGFVISEDGYIMTNYHVIAYAAVYGYDMSVIFGDGTSVDAEIIGYHEENDVAIIKIDPNEVGHALTPVTFGDSDEIAPGDVVYAIGNPLGELTYSMTDGIVSALDRIVTTTDSLTGTSSSVNMFQISAAVNAGNSGGPVYNSKGEVIGIVTAKASNSSTTTVEGLGFAIPINDAINIATQLIEKGYVASASLGITIKSTTEFYSDFAIQYYGLPTGVVAMEVNAGSAAEKAGMLKGDIITALNGTEISSIDELRYLLRQCKPGETGTITVYRFNSNASNGGYVDLEITFDETARKTTTEDSTPQETQTEPDNSSRNFGSWFGSYPFFGG